MGIMLIKRIVSRLPNSWQKSLKRLHYSFQISSGRFITHEPEFQRLTDFVSSGDWVIDVGANIGVYTKKLSDLVGLTGRVIAFEPVPETFSFLITNSQLFLFPNTSLLNLAVSDQSKAMGMKIPAFNTGLKNFYEAKINDKICDIHVLSVALDSLSISHAIKLIKIDVEGHEYPVLRGMAGLLRRDRPVLIIETSDPEVFAFLKEFGYKSEKLPGSPNVIFQTG